MDSGASGEIPRYTLGAFYIAVAMFVYCAVGEVISMECARVADVIYNSCEWYTYSPNSRRQLLMVMHHTQQAVPFNGFGLSAWDCSFANFTNVCVLRTAD